MTWETPRTWVTGELVRAAYFNAEVRNNQKAIHQRLWFGAPSIGTTAGFWYTTLAYQEGGTTPTINTVRLQPFYVPNPCGLDRIGIGVSLAQASTAARIGLYTDNGRFYPDLLIGDYGTVSTTTTGQKTIAINEHLEAGTYWLAVVTQGGTTQPSLYSMGWGIHWAVGTTSSSTVTTWCTYQRSGVSGVLPDPIGSVSASGNSPIRGLVRIVS